MQHYEITMKYTYKETELQPKYLYSNSQLAFLQNKLSLAPKNVTNIDVGISLGEMEQIRTENN